MIESKVKGILFMANQISVRDISSVDACSGSTRRFVILWMNVSYRKFARWLCENHHVVVLLPEFKTKDMIKRGFRKIHSRTARQMMTWSHYRFRQYLLYK